MSHYHARQVTRDRVFAAIARLADKNGIIEDRVIVRAAAALRVHKSIVAKDLAYFMASGELKRLTRGRYLLPGFPEPANPGPRLPLGIHTTTSGIDAVTHLRMFVGMTGAMRFVRVTLPRIPSLEKPLP